MVSPKLPSFTLEEMAALEGLPAKWERMAPVVANLWIHSGLDFEFHV